MNDKDMLLKGIIQDEEKYSTNISIMLDGVKDLIEKGKKERQACTFELIEEWRKNK